MSFPGEATVATWITTNILKLIGWGIVAALIIIALLVAWHYAVQPSKDAAKAAQAQQTISQGDVKNAHDATQIVTAHDQNEAKIQAQTRANHDVIVKAPGADVPVSDAVDAAGRAAICLRRSAVDDPQCRALLKSSP